MVHVITGEKYVLITVVNNFWPYEIHFKTLQTQFLEHFL